MKNLILDFDGNKIFAILNPTGKIQLEFENEEIIEDSIINEILKSLTTLKILNKHQQTIFRAVLERDDGRKWIAFIEQNFR